AVDGVNFERLDLAVELAAAEAAFGGTRADAIDAAGAHDDDAVRAECRLRRRLTHALERLALKRTSDGRARVRHPEHAGGDEHHLAVAQPDREIPLESITAPLRVPSADHFPGNSRGNDVDGSRKALILRQRSRNFDRVREEHER